MKKGDLDSPVLPLVTDLDDTLLKTDTLWEGFFCLLGQNPFAARSLSGLALRGGPLAVKRCLAAYSVRHADLFPVNSVVMSELEKAHAEGRAIYLASAAYKPVAEALAARFSLFSGVFASDDICNLKGEAKARRLVQEFGEKGFDYIGDSIVDVPIWRAARTALVASSDVWVHRVAREANNDCRLLPVASFTLRDYCKALRVHQWVKNILLFLPMILAHNFTPSALGMALLAFFSFSCAASATYVCNDLIDLATDRRHPTKYKRPFAAGIIPLKKGLWCIAAMTVCAALPCLVLPWLYCVCLMLYVFCTICYTAYCKRRLFLDVVALACMYVLRIIAGAAAITNNVSNWLLGFGIFFFLGLALLKRIGDSIQHKESGNLGRAYLTEDKSVLESMAAATGFSAALVAALYIDSLQAAILYTRPQILWLLFPLFLYWYGRLLIIAHRGEIGDDPVAYTMKDRTSWRCAVCGIIVLLAAL